MIKLFREIYNAEDDGAEAMINGQWGKLYNPHSYYLLKRELISSLGYLIEICLGLWCIMFMLEFEYYWTVLGATSATFLVWCGQTMYENWNNGYFEVDELTIF